MKTFQLPDQTGLLDQTVLLNGSGWKVGTDRVQRIWRREGLKVPRKTEAERLSLAERWLPHSSQAEPLRPKYENHVWSYDFVHHRTEDGRAFRTLNVLDECSRECLEIRVKRKLNSVDVIEVLADLFILRGIPAYIRSDKVPEFVAEAVQGWINAEYIERRGNLIWAPLVGGVAVITV